MSLAEAHMKHSRVQALASSHSRNIAYQRIERALGNSPPLNAASTAIAPPATAQPHTTATAQPHTTADRESDRETDRTKALLASRTGLKPGNLKVYSSSIPAPGAAAKAADDHPLQIGEPLCRAKLTKNDVDCDKDLLAQRTHSNSQPTTNPYLAVTNRQATATAAAQAAAAKAAHTLISVRTRSYSPPSTHQNFKAMTIRHASSAAAAEAAAAKAADMLISSDDERQREEQEREQRKQQPRREEKERNEREQQQQRQREEQERLRNGRKLDAPLLRGEPTKNGDVSSQIPSVCDHSSDTDDIRPSKETRGRTRPPIAKTPHPSYRSREKAPASELVRLIPDASDEEPSSYSDDYLESATHHHHSKEDAKRESPRRKRSKSHSRLQSENIQKRWQDDDRLEREEFARSRGQGPAKSATQHNLAHVKSLVYSSRDAALLTRLDEIDDMLNTVIRANEQANACEMGTNFRPNHELILSSHPPGQQLQVFPPMPPKLGASSETDLGGNLQLQQQAMLQQNWQWIQFMQHQMGMGMKQLEQQAVPPQQRPAGQIPQYPSGDMPQLKHGDHSKEKDELLEQKTREKQELMEHAHSLSEVMKKEQDALAKEIPSTKGLALEERQRQHQEERRLQEERRMVLAELERRRLEILAPASDEVSGANHWALKPPPRQQVNMTTFGSDNSFLKSPSRRQRDSEVGREREALNRERERALEREKEMERTSRHVASRLASAFVDGGHSESVKSSLGQHERPKSCPKERPRTRSPGPSENRLLESPLRDPAWIARHTYASMIKYSPHDQRDEKIRSLKADLVLADTMRKNLEQTAEEAEARYREQEMREAHWRAKVDSLESQLAMSLRRSESSEQASEQSSQLLTTLESQILDLLKETEQDRQKVSEDFGRAARREAELAEQNRRMKKELEAAHSQKESADQHFEEKEFELNSNISTLMAATESYEQALEELSTEHKALEERHEVLITAVNSYKEALETASAQRTTLESENTRLKSHVNKGFSEHANEILRQQSELAGRLLEESESQKMLKALQSDLQNLQDARSADAVTIKVLKESCELMQAECERNKVDLDRRAKSEAVVECKHKKSVEDCLRLQDGLRQSVEDCVRLRGHITILQENIVLLKRKQRNRVSETLDTKNASPKMTSASLKERMDHLILRVSGMDDNPSSQSKVMRKAMQEWRRHTDATYSDESSDNSELTMESFGAPAEARKFITTESDDKRWADQLQCMKRGYANKVAKLVAKLSVTEEAKNAAEEAKISAEEALAESQEECRELRKVLEDFESKLRSSTRVASAEAKDQMRKLGILQNNVAKLSEEKEDLANSNSELQKTLVSLSSEIENLAHDKSDLNVLLAQKEREINVLVKESARLNKLLLSTGEKSRNDAEPPTRHNASKLGNVLKDIFEGAPYTARTQTPITHPTDQTSHTAPTTCANHIPDSRHSTPHAHFSSYSHTSAGTGGKEWKEPGGGKGSITWSGAQQSTTWLARHEDRAQTQTLTNRHQDNVQRPQMAPVLLEEGRHDEDNDVDLSKSYSTHVSMLGTHLSSDAVFWGEAREMGGNNNAEAHGTAHMGDDATVTGRSEMQVVDVELAHQSRGNGFQI